MGDVKISYSSKQPTDRPTTNLWIILMLLVSLIPIPTNIVVGDGNDDNVDGETHWVWFYDE